MTVFTDRSFWEGLTAMSATSVPEVLGVETRGDMAVVRLHYRLVVDLPREAARFIDTSNVAWIQETTWNLADRSARVTFLPDQAGRLISASATTDLIDRVDSGGSARLVHGDVKVRIPMLGSRVERAIVSGVGDHLDEEAAAIQRFLA